MCERHCAAMLEGLYRCGEHRKEKLIVLHGHDAHSGAVFSLPLQRKGDIKCMARELSRFAMSLGIGELQLYCDNEPTMLQVLALTQRTLMSFGLKVTTSTSIFSESCMAQRFVVRAVALLSAKLYRHA